MTVHTQQSVIALWQDAIHIAEQRSSIKLSVELETYLVTLLMRYTNQPELAQKIFAETFLKAMQAQEAQRLASLQEVGDQCLLYAGLFPRVAERRHVKLTYFVDIGRSAYANIAKSAKDLFYLLAIKFVALMDVLQSIRSTPDLLPIEAFDQWEQLGSQRAFNILKEYTQGIPLRHFRK